MRIAFIGGGNMTTSLVGGLVRRGASGRETLRSPTPCRPRSSGSRASSACKASRTTCEAVRAADLVVLAVKPQQMAEVARGIAPQLAERRRVVVSIAAGIRLADLARWLGAGTADRAHDAQSAGADRGRGHGALRRQRRHGP